MPFPVTLYFNGANIGIVCAEYVGKITLDLCPNSTIDKCLKLSEPQFCHLWDENDNYLNRVIVIIIWNNVYESISLNICVQWQTLGVTNKTMIIFITDLLAVISGAEVGKMSSLCFLAPQTTFTSHLAFRPTWPFAGFPCL